VTPVWQVLYCGLTPFGALSPLPPCVLWLARAYHGEHRMLHRNRDNTAITVGTRHPFPARLFFFQGRCGCASQHKVFRNPTSFLDWSLFNTPFAATTTEFPRKLVTSDTVSRPLPEHSTTQTSHNNPHVCRPHRNGTPSLLSERHNAARNTRTCGIMTRHAPPVMTRK
jgi:hypothetical protein